ncbi:MAG: D-alanyl-D-alanine carboxypeptidase family protein [Candidatus Saccharimonadaceae bacterium]
MKSLKSKRRFRRFIKRHWLVLVVCFGVIGIFVLCNAWYIQTKNSEITKINQATAQQTAKMDAQIKEIKEKKAAEALQAEQAKQAEQDAAAKQAAEQSINGSASGAGTIDSKLCNLSSSHNDPKSIDVVVNKKHCIQPLDYVPTSATAYGATLNTLAIDAYKQLYSAAAAAGQPFRVTSSYRSYSSQVATYNSWVAKSGRAGADTYSARPGYSEHQTGFAFDVAAGSCSLDCFGSTSQYTWFQQNAAEYGFIQRYYSGYDAITGYKAEEWHYRYVGVAVAKDMQAKGIKTLEQYWGVSGGDY